MEASRWGDIYVHLQDKGFDVYGLSQHEGECLSPYVVLNCGFKGKYLSYSTTQEVIDFMCYHPNMSELEAYKESVKDAIKELESVYMIRDTYNETSAIYDEFVKGYMTSFQFYLYKQIKL